MQHLPEILPYVLKSMERVGEVASSGVLYHIDPCSSTASTLSELCDLTHTEFVSMPVPTFFSLITSLGLQKFRTGSFFLQEDNHTETPKDITTLVSSTRCSDTDHSLSYSHIYFPSMPLNLAQDYERLAPENAPRSNDTFTMNIYTLYSFVELIFIEEKCNQMQREIDLTLSVTTQLPAPAPVIPDQELAATHPFTSFPDVVPPPKENTSSNRNTPSTKRKRVFMPSSSTPTSLLVSPPPPRNNQNDRKRRRISSMQLSYPSGNFTGIGSTNVRYIISYFSFFVLMFS
jgi:hypothetical protein